MKKTLLMASLLSSTFALDIMTWQPYYNHSQGLTALNTYKNYLTRLGLQFWLVNSDGSLTDQSQGTTAQFVNISKSAGIKVYATIHDAGAKWEWDERVVPAISDANRDKFIKNILNVVQANNLDGVDLDLECDQLSCQNNQIGRLNYKNFVIALSDSLKVRGKELSMSTFAYHWNAPNDTWWSDYRYKLSHIQVMGYEETGHDVAVSGADLWRTYKHRVNYAKSKGWTKSQTMMGLPAYKADWLLKTKDQHVEGLVADSIPLAIWDLPQMSGWVSWAMQNSMTSLKALPNKVPLSTPALDSARVLNYDWLTHPMIQWYTLTDNLGTTPNAYQREDGLLVNDPTYGPMISMQTTLASNASAGGNTWVDLTMVVGDSIVTNEANFSYYDGILISYRSNTPVDFVAVQNSPGAPVTQDIHHQVRLPASPSFSNTWLPWSSFKQPASAINTWKFNLEQIGRFKLIPFVADKSVDQSISLDIRAIRLKNDLTGLTGTPNSSSSISSSSTISSSSVLSSSTPLSSSINLSSSSLSSSIGLSSSSSSDISTPILNSLHLAVVSIEQGIAKVRAQGLTQLTVRNSKGQILLNTQKQINGMGEFQLKLNPGAYFVEFRNNNKSQIIEYHVK